MSNYKKISCIVAGVGLVVLVAGFFLLRGTDTNSTDSAFGNVAASVSLAESDVSSTTAPAPRSVPEGFKEYRNTTYHISLFYPDSLSVKEYDEGGGAETIVFQNPDQGLGFQIFVEPYTAPQVTKAQFLRDDPSGVKTNVQNSTIDGATAAIFDSKDTVLGDTHEIWMLHSGYLYEVTTLQPLDAWLTSIMQNWQFNRALSAAEVQQLYQANATKLK